MPGFGVDFLTGMGTAGVPFLAAWFQMRKARIAQESARQERANALYEKIMGEVRSENAQLRAEVEKCKERDARLVLIETCFRMMLAELIRVDSKNEVLVHVKLLIEAGPVPSDNHDYASLLDKIEHREGGWHEVRSDTR